MMHVVSAAKNQSKEFIQMTNKKIPRHQVLFMHAAPSSVDRDIVTDFT